MEYSKHEFDAYQIGLVIEPFFLSSEFLFFTLRSPTYETLWSYESPSSATGEGIEMEVALLFLSLGLTFAACPLAVPVQPPLTYSASTHSPVRISMGWRLSALSRRLHVWSGDEKRSAVCARSGLYADTTPDGWAGWG